jgi:Ca2+-binding EF-hand superfamily protein
MLLKKWLIADKNNDGKIDFDEFRDIIKNFNIRSKKSDLRRSFNVRDNIPINK